MHGKVQIFCQVVFKIKLYLNKFKNIQGLLFNTSIFQQIFIRVIQLYKIKKIFKLYNFMIALEISLSSKKQSKNVIKTLNKHN